MTITFDYEARADELLQHLIWGWPIPWYKTKVDMREIRGIWRDERLELLTGEAEPSLESRLRSDVKDDWRQFLWDWCVEAAQVERR